MVAHFPRTTKLEKIMTQVHALPEHWKNYYVRCDQLQKVAERRRLHQWIRPTFPTYDVTRQLT